MNIFKLASQNAENLKHSYHLLEGRCKNKNELDVFNEFVRLIKDKWTISINMRPFVLNNFLITNSYKNIYELKKEIENQLERMGKSGISIEQAIKKHLKGYYKQRTTFDRTFEDGEKFKYGALTIGGPGLKKYGEYCIVIKRKQSEKYATLAFIKEDSFHYVDGDHVDMKRLSQDIADKECVHVLAALKHEEDIKNIPVHKWTSLICGGECYIEAVTAGNIQNKHIESVRISKKYYDFIRDLFYKEFISEISDEERGLLYDFKNIKELSKKQGINLEVIEP